MSATTEAPLLAWMCDDGEPSEAAELVFARTEGEARALAWAERFRANWGRDDREDVVNVSRRERADVLAVGAPRVVEEAATLRAAGFTWQGEPTCIHCGLSGTGSKKDPPEWRVCDEDSDGCGACGDCGHADDCPKRVAS